MKDSQLYEDRTTSSFEAPPLACQVHKIKPANLVLVYLRRSFLCSLGILMALLSGATQAQAQSSITGTVTDDAGEALPGVTVVEKGTQNGSITDVNGAYKIVVEDDATIVYSYIGFETIESALGSRSVVDVIMYPDVEELEEIVVTAYGIEKTRKSVGYAITEIKGDELTQAKDVSVASLLYGKVSGAAILSPATGPNGSTGISLRGVDGFGGDRQPLIVVDGVPIDNTVLGEAGEFGGIDRGDAFSSINPDDIESINVLKGASAGTLYGERGANGVIMITTKKGQKGLSVEYNTTYMVDAPAFFQDFFQNEYGQGRRGERPGPADVINQWTNWGERLDGSDFQYYDGEIRPYSASPDDDFKSYYRNGHTFTNNLSVSGGSENITSRLSISHLDNEGIIEAAEYERFTINSLSTLNMNDKFTMTVKANYVEEKSINRTNHGDFPSNPGKAFINVPTNISASMLRSTVRNNDVIDRTTSSIPWNDNVFIPNPFWGTEVNLQDDTKRRLTGFFMAKYQILDQLSLQVRYAADWTKVDDRFIVEQGSEWEPNGSYNQSSTELNDNTLDFILAYSQRLGKVGINANFGGVQNVRNRSTYQIGGGSFIVPEIYHINNLEFKSPPVYRPLEWQTNGLYATSTFDFENVIFLEGSVRQEWYSTLTADPQLGENTKLYWSSSVSGLISELLELPSAINYLKVRTSFGVAGNGAPDPYQILPVYAIQGLNYTGQFGEVSVGEVFNRNSNNVDTYPNPFLNVTRTQAVEVGVEAGFFKNRLKFDLTLYKQNTFDNIEAVQVPSFTGYPLAWANVGEIENKGFELSLSGRPIERSELSYDISLNLTRNQNELLSLADGIEALTGERARRLGYIRSAVGEQVGNIYGSKFVRDAGGNVVHDDSGFPLIENDQLLGNFTPDYFGGLTNTVNYKNLTLSVLMDFKFGGEILSLSNAAALANGKHQETLTGRDNPFFEILGKGVTESGEANSEFVFLDQYYGQLSNIAEHSLFDASFLKVRQITLSYDLPSTLIRNTPFRSVRVGFVSRNLLFLYNGLSDLGMDPEAVYSTSGSGFEFASIPTSRSMGFNINMKF